MPVVTTGVDQCLSENAKTVLERRYLRKSSGQVIETPEEMFWRIVSDMAEVMG